MGISGPGGGRWGGGTKLATGGSTAEEGGTEDELGGRSELRAEKRLERAQDEPEGKEGCTEQDSHTQRKSRLKMAMPPRAIHRQSRRRRRLRLPNTERILKRLIATKEPMQ